MKTTNLSRNLTATAVAAVLALGLTACGSDDEPAPVAAEPSASASTDATTSPDRDDDRDDRDARDADDQPIDAETRDRLERIALDEVGQGRVDDVERSDDRTHAYEVDIDLSGDEDVTVEIDEDFEVVRVDR